MRSTGQYRGNNPVSRTQDEILKKDDGIEGIRSVSTVEEHQNVLIGGYEGSSGRREEFQWKMRQPQIFNGHPISKLHYGINTLRYRYQTLSLSILSTLSTLSTFINCFHNYSHHTCPTGLYRPSILCLTHHFTIYTRTLVFSYISNLSKSQLYRRRLRPATQNYRSYRQNRRTPPSGGKIQPVKSTFDEKSSGNRTYSSVLTPKSSIPLSIPSYPSSVDSIDSYRVSFSIFVPQALPERNY